MPWLAVVALESQHAVPGPLLLLSLLLPQPDPPPTPAFAETAQTVLSRRETNPPFTKPEA